MPLIRAAAVVTVVLSLLLPPSIQATANSTEEIKRKSNVKNTIAHCEAEEYMTHYPRGNSDISDNEEVPLASKEDTSEPMKELPTTETDKNNGSFTCYNGEFITFEKVCDGILDCPDGTDEKCLFGTCDNTNECQCAATKECIPRNNSHLYLFEDDDFPENFNVQPGQSLILHCPTSIANQTVWYRNDQTVPSDCIIKYHASNSSLFCPNMTSLHEGVYSCERYYDDILLEPEIIRTAVLIGEESSFKQPSCFCFGTTTRCESTRVNYKSLINDGEGNEMFDTTWPYVVLTMTNGQYTLVEANTTETMDRTVYYPLFYDIIDNELDLYGGFILYDLNTKSARIGVDDVSSPLAVMRGDDKVLLYQPDAYYNSLLNRRRLSFSPFNWNVFSKEGNTEKATDRDMMLVLKSLDGIYVRLERGIDENDFYSHFFLYMIESDPLGPLSYIGKCSCPPEYNGTYCEICAVDYTRGLTNNSCVRIDHQVGGNTKNDDDASVQMDGREQESDMKNTIDDFEYTEYTDSNDTSDSENYSSTYDEVYSHQPVDKIFTCYDGQSITFEKVCDGILDCLDGTDEKCIFEACKNTNECQCDATEECILRNNSYFYLLKDDDHSENSNVQHGQSMTLYCPTNNTVQINWYRNNDKVPSDCTIKYQIGTLLFSALS